LVECNQKFVDLLGYPLHVLQNNFTCGRLIQSPKCTSNDDPKDHEHTTTNNTTTTTTTNNTTTTTTATNIATNNANSTALVAHSPSSSSSSSLEQQPNTPHQKEQNTQTQQTPQHNPNAHSTQPARQSASGPKKAVLMVADGSTRSAMITITPVHDSKNFVKYYILHAQTIDD